MHELIGHICGCIERAAALAAILRQFAETLALLQQPAKVVPQWEAAAGIPGARYRIALDNSQEGFDATAVSLDVGGALEVRRDDGVTNRIEMADARILR